MKRATTVGLIAAAIVITGLAGYNSWFKSSAKKDNPAPNASLKDSIKQDDAAGNANTAKSQEPPKAKWQAVLYFPDNQGQKLIKEIREIEIEKDKNQTDNKLSEAEKAKACIEELVKGPANQDLTASIPKKTRVNSVKLDKDTFIVDLSKDFVQDNVGGITGVMMALEPIVLTLTEIDGAKQVGFKIDGEILKEFKGEIEFDRPFKRTEFEKDIAK